MTILCSANTSVRTRWKDALDHLQPQPREATELPMLQQMLSAQRSELVLLHLSLPLLGGKGGVARMRRDHPDARLLVFADRPDEAEGIELLQAGIYGYCNTYMASALLGRAVAAVAAGEVWVGWNLMQRLIRGLAPADAADPERTSGALAALTEREKEIVRHISGGASNKVIAASLGITERTVKAHLGAIFRKTGTQDRLQLALLVSNQGARSAADAAMPRPVRIPR